MKLYEKEINTNIYHYVLIPETETVAPIGIGLKNDGGVIGEKYASDYTKIHKIHPKARTFSRFPEYGVSGNVLLHSQTGSLVPDRYEIDHPRILTSGLNFPLAPGIRDPVSGRIQGILDAPYVDPIPLGKNFPLAPGIDAPYVNPIPLGKNFPLAPGIDASYVNPIPLGQKINVIPEIKRKYISKGTLVPKISLYESQIIARLNSSHPEYKELTKIYLAGSPSSDPRLFGDLVSNPSGTLAKNKRGEYIRIPPEVMSQAIKYVPKGFKLEDLGYGKDSV